MTKKVLDLAVATEEWMRARFKRPDGIFSYDSHISHRLGGRQDHPERESILAADRISTLLADELDLDSVERLYLERGNITIYAGRSLDAKNLNRLMNTELHHNGAVYRFIRIGLKADMESDRYMGEITEFPRALFEIEYARV